MHKKRYFIIYFQATNPLTKLSMIGNIAIETENNKFINQEGVKKGLMKNMRLINPVITNIQEVSKDDFEEYVRPLKEK